MDDFFDLYDLLIDGIDTAETVTRTFMGQCWTAVETEKSFGMAMTTPVDTAPRMYEKDFIGMPLAELAKAAKSWNLREAGFGMAAVNAYYNTPKRLEALGAYEPFENYCTDGVDLQGKHIGVVGHLNMPESVYQQASSVRILAGPSCPMCPALLSLGIDRIAGLVVTDVTGMKNKILNEIPGPPYPMGKPFLLKKENL